MIVLVCIEYPIMVPIQILILVGLPLVQFAVAAIRQRYRERKFFEQGGRRKILLQQREAQVV